MMGLLKDALSLNTLEITEKRRRKEIFYLPNTINCTWSLTLGSGRSFMESDITIEYMNSSSLVTGFLKLRVDLSGSLIAL